jgi:hypothetical protein
MFRHLLALRRQRERESGYDFEPAEEREVVPPEEPEY